MRVIGLVGWSGSGKTTLLVEMIGELTARGYSVSTVKHAHHAFDLDQPGKDSHRHRRAGATEVMVASASRWALLHELAGAPEPSLDQLLAHMSPADLVLVEGFKHHHHDKIEVHRPALGQPLMAAGDPSIIAIASDAPFDGAPAGNVVVLDLNDPPAIARFVLSVCGIAAAPPAPAERAR